MNCHIIGVTDIMRSMKHRPERYYEIDDSTSQFSHLYQRASIFPEQRSIVSAAGSGFIISRIAYVQQQVP